MNRSEFDYLFIHANSLAELALHEMASALEEDQTLQGDQSPPLSEEDRDAQALSLLQGMDLSAMDRVSWENDKHDAEVQRVLEELSTTAADPAGSAETAPLSHEARELSPGGVDLGRYLENAYASRPQLTGRIEASMARIDQLALADVISALPAKLPRLTEPLTAEGLAQCLAAYQAGDDALNALVVLIRSSDEN